ncbi:SDR family oxidoreductase [Dawidia soli]|uniref:SDR family oxidoreductase n=1 Tax=Dawidia soli TaxID=2782352 RepID=A0AAP2DGY5_9BACT|nr:SDR family oxidoreductase [Dawidia soli]MBT1690505.1 SDR family oxidoreductase [Dawidia soli]
MNAFENKVAVVTGGNSGIGFATAQALKQQGAKVVITGRRKEPLHVAAKSLEVDHYHGDQGTLADTDGLVRYVASHYGKVDILVVNAGVAAFQPIAVTSEETFDTMVGINFKGAFFAVQKFLPILQDGAAIVMISSNSASMSTPGTSVYAASKAALNTLMRIAAVEFAPRKIRVNVVSPGPTDTDIVHKFGFDEQTLKGMREAVIRQVPLSKTGTANDVASLILYLANNETSSFITGGEFFIDGGMTIK